MIVSTRGRYALRVMLDLVEPHTAAVGQHQCAYAVVWRKHANAAVALHYAVVAAQEGSHAHKQQHHGGGAHNPSAKHEPAAAVCC